MKKRNTLPKERILIYMNGLNKKILKHPLLSITISFIFYFLLGSFLYAALTSLDNNYDKVFAMWWWPWVFAVMIGLTLFLMISEDKFAIEFIFDLPRLLIYSIILLAWYILIGQYIPEVREALRDE